MPYSLTSPPHPNISSHFSPLAAVPSSFAAGSSFLVVAHGRAAPACTPALDAAYIFLNDTLVVLFNIHAFLPTDPQSPSQASSFSASSLASVRLQSHF